MKDRESLDRKLGRWARTWLGSVPGGRRAGTIASEALAPTFVLLVLGLLGRSESRRTGIEAGVSAGAAALVAKALRDGIGRPRPGERAGGGFPSRHAAAAVAIARAVSRRNGGGLGVTVAAAAGVGLLGRIADAQHDPADIIAGSALGWYTDVVVEQMSERLPV